MTIPVKLTGFNPKATMAASASALLLATGQSAAAKDDAGAILDIDFSLVAVSDYRYRGVSSSDRNPAIQPELSIEHKSGLYVGLWGSLVPGDNRSTLSEVDAWIGLRQPFGDFTLDVSALYYIFPGLSDYNYAELSTTLSRQVGKAELAVNVSYAPRQSAIGDRDNLYLGASATLPVHSRIELTGSLGSEDRTDGVHKLDWQAAVIGDLGDGFELGLSYVDTAGFGPAPAGKAGIVATISKEF